MEHPFYFRIRNKLDKLLKEERGVALVFVLLCLLILTPLVLLQLLNATVESKSVTTTRDSLAAIYSADAGIREAIARISYGSQDDETTGGVRQWIPSDMVTNVGQSGYDANNPLTWLYVNNNGVNDPNESAGTGATIDDWAEYYPDWQVNIWNASAAWVEANKADLPGGNSTSSDNGIFNVPTLMEVNASYATLVEYGQMANPLNHTMSAKAKTVGGVTLTFKKDVPGPGGNIIFTDGVKQFTMAQGLSPIISGGLGLNAGQARAYPVVQIESTGMKTGMTRRIVAEVARFPISVPQTAVYACSSNPPSFGGNGVPMVSGYDYPLYCTAEQVCAQSGYCPTPAATSTPVQSPIPTNTPLNSPTPTQTFINTNTPAVTNTPVPTNTPGPSNTPAPSSTPVTPPTPCPGVSCGSGSKITNYCTGECKPPSQVSVPCRCPSAGSGAPPPPESLLDDSSMNLRSALSGMSALAAVPTAPPANAGNGGECTYVGQPLEPQFGNSGGFWDTLNPPLDPNSNPPVPAVTVCCPSGPGMCTGSNAEGNAVATQIPGGVDTWGANTGDGDSYAIGELDIDALYDAYKNSVSPPYMCGGVSCAPDGNTLASLGSLTAPPGFGVALLDGADGTGVSGALHFPDIYGVLLIKVKQGQTASIAGNTRITGLLVVVGDGTLAFSGTVGIVGSVLVGGKVTMQGNPSILYSAAAVNAVTTVGRYRTLRMYEDSMY